MKQYAGIDVSLESSSVCVVDAEGRIVREAKVPSEPDALIAWFAEHGVAMERIGLEAGPLSQWLHAAMAKAGLAVELLETRHVRAAFKTMPVKTDKKDARGIAQLMRLGWFRPVHCKSLPAQEVRALLTARKLLQGKLHDVEMSIRGILRGFGLKVGPTTPGPTRHGSGADRRSSDLGGDRRGAVEGARRSCGRVCAVSSDACGAWPVEDDERAAADDHARRRRSGRADLRVGGRRAGAVPILASGGAALRPDAEEVSVGRDRLHRADLQDRRRRRPNRALRGGQRHPDPAGQRLGPEDLGARRRQTRRHAQGEGRAGPQARGRAAPDAARPTDFVAHKAARRWPPEQEGDNTLFGRALTISPPEPSPFAGTTDHVRPQLSAAASQVTAPNERSAGGSSARHHRAATPLDCGQKQALGDG